MGEVGSLILSSRSSQRQAGTYMDTRVCVHTQVVGSENMQCYGEYFITGGELSNMMVSSCTRRASTNRTTDREGGER